MIVAGGGVHYSLATDELATFAETHRVPVVETIAGRASLVHDHPNNAGPLGVIGSASANALAAEADVVLAVGTRLQDFTTGSWTVFGNPDVKLIALNAARFDATKHRALAVVGDAQVGLTELSAALAGWRAPAAWASGRRRVRRLERAWSTRARARPTPSCRAMPMWSARSTGSAIRPISRSPPPAACRASSARTGGPRRSAPSTASSASPAWATRSPAAGAPRWPNPERDVIVFVGDGSYLMMNSDIYSTVLTGHKLIVVVCDNGGFAVINRLQNGKGSASFNNLIEDCRRVSDARVDFAKHAESMGAIAEKVHSIGELEAAFERAKTADRTYVVVIEVDAHQWTPGDAWWDVAVPEVSQREAVRKARADHDRAAQKQRIGV